MNNIFSLFCMLITTFLIHFISQCNNSKINEIENHLINNFQKIPKNENLNIYRKKEDEENNISHNLVEKGIHNHNNHISNNKKEKIESIEKLKTISKKLKDGHLILENENMKNEHDPYNTSYINYILNEINNNDKLNKNKENIDEIKLLEENSQKLLNDIHDWSESIKNVKEKSKILKDIKNDILHNILSLNDTLKLEMENINKIKKLQKEQNDIFSESWLYIFPHGTEYLESEKEYENSNNSKDLERYNTKESNDNKYGIRKHNIKSISFHIYLNYFIILLILITIFN